MTSLDDIAQNPAAAEGLPLHVRSRLIARCAAVIAILSAAEPGEFQAPAVAAVQSEDRLLTAEQAAEQLAVPLDWIYRRGKRLGLTVQLGPGTLRFSTAAIQRFIRRRANGSQPA